MVEQRESLGHKFEKIVLIFDYTVPDNLDFPNLEVKVDYRPLYWDSKKRVWRYLEDGEGYMEGHGGRILAPPAIVPVDPLILPGMLPPMHLHI